MFSCDSLSEFNFSDWDNAIVSAQTDAYSLLGIPYPTPNVGQIRWRCRVPWVNGDDVSAPEEQTQLLKPARMIVGRSGAVAENKPVTVIVMK